MLFNVDKCEVMHLGFNNPRTNYAMGANQLQDVSKERVLWIIVSADLKWDKECIAGVKKANKIPPHHNHFTALFPEPPGWTGARRELLDFMVQGR